MTKQALQAHIELLLARIEVLELALLRSGALDAEDLQSAALAASEDEELLAMFQALGVSRRSAKIGFSQRLNHDLKIAAILREPLDPEKEAMN